MLLKYLLSFTLDADRAPQLKAVVGWLRFLTDRSMKKPKILYITTALLTFVIGLGVAGTFVFSLQRFRVVDRDGTVSPGLGQSGKGISMAVTTWVSSAGVKVEEVTVSFPSIEDARHDFELESSFTERLREQNYDLNAKRVVGRYGLYFKVITLDEKSIHSFRSSNLDTALACEASWLRLEWW